MLRKAGITVKCNFSLFWHKKRVSANNTSMNQIIALKKTNQKRKNLFKLQFVVSILALIISGFYYLRKWKKESEMEKLSQMMNQVFQVEAMYSARKTNTEAVQKESLYFGKITIPKLELEYSVFNECTDELLKILPCKFYGDNIEKQGNIGSAGHNYDDQRFFGNLNQLKKGDSVYLESQNGTQYQYIVYDKYKVAPDDFKCLQPKRKYDLTLLTCDNFNHKRLVIKASR